MNSRHLRFVALVVGVSLVVALAVPVVAADPPGRENAPGQNKAKAPKAPELTITLSGTVVQTTDAKGRATFEMTVDGTTWELSAGPKWWHAGGSHPLAAYAGKSVQVTGSHREGSTDVDVATVDGKALRSAGRPPWAGGPKATGERHPGFKAWKGQGAAGQGKDKGTGHGRANAPGQLKDKSKPADDEAIDSD